MTEAGIEAYMSYGTADCLSLLDNHYINIVEHGKTYKVGDYAFTPFDTKHNASEPLGYVITDGEDKVLFVTDTAYIRNRFRGLTKIVVECNYILDILNRNRSDDIVHTKLRNAIRGSHFGLDAVIGFLKTIDLTLVTEINLIHLSASNSDEKMIKRRVQEATGKLTTIIENN